MATTTYSAAEAAARAVRYTKWQTMYCLNFVRNMLTPTVTAPAGGLPDAITAWNKATQKVTTGVPPAGAPVYWRTYSHKWGHIAVSLGNGYCRSTDWPTKGAVGTVAISTLTSRWGMTYLGWSRDYAGLTIEGIEAPTQKPPTTPTSTTLKRGSKSAAVKRLQANLLRVFPAYAAPIKANGGPVETYGPATEKVVREFQKRAGVKVDGIVGATTWAALRRFGIKP